MISCYHLLHGQRFLPKTKFELHMPMTILPASVEGHTQFRCQFDERGLHIPVLERFWSFWKPGFISFFFSLLIYFSLIMSYFNVFFSGWSKRHIVISWDPAYVCVCLGLILEKEMATHSSILSWRIPWIEEPGGLQSMGSQTVGHNWATSLSLFTLVWFKSVTFTTCYS